MSDLIAIVTPLIGRRWSSAWDCWGFVRQVYREAYAIALPELPGVDGADARQGAAAIRWQRTRPEWRRLTLDQVVAGDVVTMGVQEGRPHHVGIWLAIDGGRVAHCDQHAGVCCHSLRQLRAQRWGGFEFFRHKDHP
jgi:hypothetical protein